MTKNEIKNELVEAGIAFDDDASVAELREIYDAAPKEDDSDVESKVETEAEVGTETETETVSDKEDDDEDTDVQDKEMSQDDTDVVELKSKGVATVSYRGLSRDYSKEIHGSEFKKLAQSFATKFGGTIS